MVGGRRKCRPTYGFHRTIDDLFDTLDRRAIKDVAMKFIASSLNNFTVTVVLTDDGQKRRFYSNFDPLNQAILRNLMGES
jgi:hypothetical protein